MALNFQKCTIWIKTPIFFVLMMTRLRPKDGPPEQAPTITVIVCVVLRKLAGNRVQSESSFFFLLPIYSDVQILAMTHSPFCAICWFCAPIVHISLLSVGRALAFFSLRFIYSARIQIKIAMISNLNIINEANRTPTQTNFTFCFLKDHLFSLLQEQPQSIHRREM